MTRLRLDARDDLMHEVDQAVHFNESMYFNVYDRAASLGAFFRIGNRPNEGIAEVTCCVYLPDGRVAFGFARPPITSNERFGAGGMGFEVLEPMQRLRVSWDGSLCLLEAPLAMADPKRAFTENPWIDASASLIYEACAPAFGGEPADGQATNDFARGHYTQHVAARGAVRVGTQEWAIDGLGLRDHSWGPRLWQSVWWYRWLTGMFDRGHGFVISVIGNRDGSLRVGGVMLDGGELDPVEDASIETEWDGDRHRGLRAQVATASGATHVIEGRVRSLVPLRNRREDMVTRITEGLTEWRAGSMTGYGLSEYLDQIVDGHPVGDDVR